MYRVDKAGEGIDLGGFIFGYLWEEDDPLAM